MLVQIFASCFSLNQFDIMVHVHRMNRISSPDTTPEQHNVEQCKYIHFCHIGEVLCQTSGNISWPYCVMMLIQIALSFKKILIVYIMCNYLPLREAKFVFQGFSNKLHYIGVLVSLPYICNVMEGNILFYFYLCIYFRKYFAEIITCNTVVLSVQHNFFF